MRQIRFKQRAAPAPAGHWQHAPLAEFLLKTPHLAYAVKVFGVIPPRRILNELLLSGMDDAGMGGGCEWKPFEIDECEYSELVEEWSTAPGFAASLVPELVDKLSFVEWQMGVIERHTRGRSERS